jgi:hypothetical protein
MRLDLEITIEGNLEHLIFGKLSSIRRANNNRVCFPGPRSRSIYMDIRAQMYVYAKAVENLREKKNTNYPFPLKMQIYVQFCGIKKVKITPTMTVTN